MKKVYFVTIGKREEIEVIRKVKPPRLLCSYWYFKNKRLEDFCNAIGYKPEILLDSGAYSASTSGKSVNLFDYMKFIDANKEYISRYIALDVIGNPFATKLYYQIMRHEGYEPIPVHHYGDNEENLQYYASQGVVDVALGNTVGIRDKATVSRWCESLGGKYHFFLFHLLGSSCNEVLDCDAIVSCDSSSWYKMAINGKPKTVPTKLGRAEVNMRKTMEAFNANSLPFDDCHGKCSDCGH